MNKHLLLPPTWVWTREIRTPSGALLFAARDTRWEPRVPDVVDVSEAYVIAYAFECDAVRRAS